jgi:hypothetical protein
MVAKNNQPKAIRLRQGARDLGLPGDPAQRLPAPAQALFRPMTTTPTSS